MLLPLCHMVWNDLLKLKWMLIYIILEWDLCNFSAKMLTFFKTENTKASTTRLHFILTVPCLILAPQVGAKRTNRPGISTTDRGFPRARFRSRGGSFSSRARYYSGYTPPRGRGRAFRWAAANTPYCGRTLHLHALHITHCFHSQERTGQTRKTTTISQN